MELDHFHVAQFQTGIKRHGHTVAGLVARRRVIKIHGWPATTGQQHSLGTNEEEFTGPHIDHHDAGKRVTGGGLDQRNGPAFFQPAQRIAHHLLHQPVDDLDSRQIAFMDCAVKALPGESFLMQRAIGVAVKEAAEFIFKLMDTLNSGCHQPPGEILIGQPFAADNGVHEVTLNGIRRVQRHIVATLHHPGAAAFADQSLDRQCGFKVGSRLLGMESGKQPCPAGADDQDVGVELFNRLGHQISSLSV